MRNTGWQLDRGGVENMQEAQRGKIRKNLFRSYQSVKDYNGRHGWTTGSWQVSMEGPEPESGFRSVSLPVERAARASGKMADRIPAIFVCR